MADIWTPIKYGWSHVYWLTVEGVPYVWSQAATSKTLPAGYTAEVPALVVADSARVGAVIDRDKGIGAGFPLTFTVLDCDELSSLMARPGAVTHLTQDLAAGGATADVDNTADFAASGTAYIGKETLTYSSKTATTLTLSARGLVGLAYPHAARSTATLVSDKPRYWRGRFVTLYASPVDPSGYVTGTALDNDALVIWRGYLDSEPSRSDNGDGFAFSALPIDRILARPLASRLSGVVQDTDVRFEIQDTQCTINLELINGGGTTIGGGPWAIKFDAMASATPGDLVSITEFNASAIAAFAAAVTAHGIGAYVNGLDIIQAQSTPSDPTYGAYNKGDWVPIVRLAQNSSAQTLKHSAIWCGNVAEVPNALTPNGTVAIPPPGLVNNQPLNINIAYAWTPYSLTNGHFGTGSGGGSKPKIPSAAIVLDEGDPGTLPEQGQVEIGGNVFKYVGTGITAAAGSIVLKKLFPVGATIDLSTIVDAEASILISDSGNLADTTLRMIHSSGETNLRDATYDKLLGRVGYGLPDTYADADKMQEVLAAGFLADIDLTVSPDAKAYADTLGGLLALSQRAVVVTDDGASDARLSAVYTGAGAGGYAAQLTDAHVLSVPAANVTTETVSNPNTIVVDVELGDAKIAPLRQTDASRVAFEGAQEAKYSVPSADADKLIQKAAVWALARIAGDQHAATLSIDVVPWLGVRIGDAVDLALTHPKIWNWADSTIGYSGRARCVGRELQLSTGAMRLRLLIYGQSVGSALCPAAPVLAFTGLATAPTTIDVPSGFVIEFGRALKNNGANLRLLHYQPGQGAEGITQGFTISAATITGGVCRLTVATVIGAPTVSASTSYLTWAETANAGAYEKTFAHANDGGVWT